MHATDSIHRNLEKYFEDNGIYYERRTNYYRNQGKKRDLIISISGLAQAVNAIYLQRPHESRAKPASLIKETKKSEEIFDENKPYNLYVTIAKIIMRIEKFLKTDAAKIYTRELKYHLAMYSVAKILKKIKPLSDDLKPGLENDIDDKFLLGCLEEINIEIQQHLKNRGDSINKFIKNSESSQTIKNLLSNYNS